MGDGQVTKERPLGLDEKLLRWLREDDYGDVDHRSLLDQLKELAERTRTLNRVHVLVTGAIYEIERLRETSGETR